jgi:hypothetical protein
LEFGDLLLSLGQGTRRIRDPIDLGACLRRLASISMSFLPAAQLRKATRSFVLHRPRNDYSDRTIPGMWVWREALYAFMQRNAERSAAYFCIPAAQVVESPQSAGYLSETGKRRFASDCVVGPGGLEPSTRPL